MDPLIAMPCRRALPGRIKRQGKLLLNQQCWLWGQDVKRQDPNLLLQHGFVRVRPPEGVAGSTQYSLALGNGIEVRLWGFGIYFGGKTGLYLNRFDFFPRAMSTECDVWQAHALTRLPRAHDFTLLPSLVGWIARYEQWVLESMGASYRSACLSAWKKRTEDAATIAGLWAGLANDLKAFVEEDVDVPASQSSLEHSGVNAGCRLRKRRRAVRRAH